MPQIERALDACLDSLRSARSADRELAKLDWNRVQLYVWPAGMSPPPSSARSSGHSRRARKGSAWSSACSSGRQRGTLVLRVVPVVREAADPAS